MKNWIIAIQACAIALLLGIAIAGALNGRPTAEPDASDHNVGWVERSRYDYSYRDKLDLGNLEDCLTALKRSIDWGWGSLYACDDVVRSY